MVTGAITAGASVSDAILSHFGRKRAESTNNAIEENTRTHMLLFADYRQSVGFFQNDELQRHRGLLEYVVANGDDMKASLWSIRDSLMNGIPVSGLAGSGVSDFAEAVQAGNSGDGAGRDDTQLIDYIADAFQPILGRRPGEQPLTDDSTFTAPGNSRTAQTPEPQPRVPVAPIGSRTNQRQQPTAEEIGDATRDALEARNPFAVIAAELGNPLAQLVTGSNFMPAAIESQTAATEDQTTAIQAGADDQVAAIRESGEATSGQLARLHEAIHGFVESVQGLLGRDIVVAIDGQEIARAVGAGQESLRATA